MDPNWWWVLALLMILVGLAGTLLPALPGLPFIFGGLWLGAHIDQYAQVSGWVIVILGVMTAGAMSLDFMAGVLGAKRVGASKEALIGSALGAVAGLFFGLIGIFIGPFVGAFIGEYIARGKLGEAGKVGIGTWLGIVAGAVVKIATAVMMMVIFAFAYFVA
ncbi:MAG: DUF456 domain-containing protein [Betaproteobacteria bacterium]|nr:DUF456 domain-containing protein [Betaproteobacteria bacterium]